MSERSVFFVSDGTGITAETFGNSILNQFPAKPRHVRRPFIDTVDKAMAVVDEINQVTEAEGKRSIVFITLIDDAVRSLVTGPGCKGLVLDIKSKEFTDPAKVDAYDEHMMQLSAYRVGLGIPDAVTANVFVSVLQPGLVVVKQWTPEEAGRGWTMFQSLLNFWQAKNQHK
jgi:hypothetical protein